MCCLPLSCTTSDLFLNAALKKCFYRRPHVGLILYVQCSVPIGGRGLVLHVQCFVPEAGVLEVPRSYVRIRDFVRWASHDMNDDWGNDHGWGGGSNGERYAANNALCAVVVDVAFVVACRVPGIIRCCCSLILPWGPMTVA